MAWVSLHTHSQYSVLNSTASIKALASKAKSFGMESLALTDSGNLFGAVEFFKACKAEGIKPIIGCELFIAPKSRSDKMRISGVPNSTSAVFLVKNSEGYKNLCKLSSIGYTEGFYYVPRVDKEVLQTHCGGLVCIARDGDVAWLSELFGDDFYFDLRRHKMVDDSVMGEESWLYQQYHDYIQTQEKRNNELLAMGGRCVATNDIHYLDKEDWQAHEVLMNVQAGEPVEIWDKDPYGKARGKKLNPKRKVLSSREFYFKSPEEMEALFSDIPEAIAMSEEIAAKCEFELDLQTKHYPVYTPPHLEGTSLSEAERAKAAEDHLRMLCDEGIASRYTQERLEEVAKKYPGQEPLAVVKERLASELDIITSKGMCDYLLIVYDFIAWAKGKGIPVGPGRGSGAGSIILYLIGITDIEPLRFNLFFERFINPERLSYPDIDVDICMERRQEVIEYTLNKYGKDKVAQIITFGTMKAKMAIRDVGRMLSVPLSKVNEIAKLVPEDPTMTLQKAFEIDPELKKLEESDEEAARVLEFAKKLEGSIRNTGVHAAGLIIAGEPLTEYIPVCVAKDAEMALTQYSMKPVEAVGMLKIDFLGLKTLTSIQKAVEAVKKADGTVIDWVNLPLDNKATFDLLNQGKTLGVFQLESGGMQDLAKHLHIDKFEEIIAVGALYRPGPMEMIPSFINRKHGREEIEVDHSAMKDVIEETYGIMVYQEQVMQISQILAGYSLGEGDVLRRAMGKKDHAEMETQREKFRLGALEKGIDETTSMTIFDKIQKFASYGFNKSHAAAYGFLSYVTAYLKANHPRQWLAALMTCDIDDLTKVAKHIREALAMGIPLLSPDVNESGIEFVGTPSGIRFALSGIKGVGRGVAEAIVTARESHGHFSSLLDFCVAIDSKKVGKKVIESLVDAGALDSLGWSRLQLMEGVSPIYEAAARKQKEDEKGILDLFSSSSEQDPLEVPPEVEGEFPKQERLRREKELLGFYLTGHPMDDFSDTMKRLSCVPLHKLAQAPDGTACRIACIVETVKVRITSKSQRKFAILNISDGMDRFELPIWPAIYDDAPELFVEGQLLYAVVQIEKEDGGVKLSCKWVDDLTRCNDSMIQAADNAYDKAKDQVRMAKRRESMKPKQEEVRIKGVTLAVDIDSVNLSHILTIKRLIAEHPGKSPVKISFLSKQKEVGKIMIESDLGVRLGSGVEALFKELPPTLTVAVWEQC